MLAPKFLQLRNCLPPRSGGFEYAYPGLQPDIASAAPGWSRHMFRL